MVSVFEPDSFFPDISIRFCPSISPIFRITRPSGLNEKLVLIEPLIEIFTSFQVPTLVVWALIKNWLVSTVTGEGGLINLMTGTGLLCTVPVPVPVLGGGTCVPVRVVVGGTWVTGLVVTASTTAAAVVTMRVTFPMVVAVEVPVVAGGLLVVVGFVGIVVGFVETLREVSGLVTVTGSATTGRFGIGVLLP